MRKKEMTKEEALGKLESLCSRSEQCEWELEQKLFRWGIRPSDRKEILESLREGRYVDDERFAGSYARDKAKFSSWGPGKIRMELAKRKIKAPVVSEALRSVENEVWKEGLMKNLRAKARSLDLDGENSYEEKQKLFRYLIGRGFPAGAISVAIRKIKGD